MSFKLEGMDELLRNLEQLGNQADNVKEKALLAGAEPIQKEIQKNAPRSNITNEHGADHIIVEYDKKNEQAYVGAEKEKGWWLLFPEFGTSKQPAQGFTEKSFHDSKNDAQKEMANVIKRELGLL